MLLSGFDVLGFVILLFLGSVVVFRIGYVSVLLVRFFCIGEGVFRFFYRVDGGFFSIYGSFFR